PQLLTLTARIHQQERSAAQDIGIQFLLARGVRAHGGDVGAGLQVGGVQQREAGSRHRDNQARRPGDIGGRTGERDFDLRKRRLEIAPALRRALGIAAPDANLPQGEDFGVHAGLPARLYAGAEDAEHTIAAAAVRTSVRCPASARNATGSPVSADESSIIPLPTASPRARLPGNVAAIFNTKYLPPRR